MPIKMLSLRRIATLVLLVQLVITQEILPNTTTSTYPIADQNGTSISSENPAPIEEMQTTQLPAEEDGSDKPPDLDDVAKFIALPTDEGDSSQLPLDDFPANCSKRELERNQPVHDSSSRLLKCCPYGESLVYDEASGEHICNTISVLFKPEVVEVILYDNCIEDTGAEVTLEVRVENPCTTSIKYNRSEGDQIYVIQDGSLLVMDEFGNKSYNIERSYCLDTDHKTGEIYAFVCEALVEDHLGRGQTILFAILMMTSIPCLIFVSFIHFSIRELRSVHGLSLGCLSNCLAIGFFLHSVAQLSDNYKSTLGHAVQFFMLSYFFWLFALCSNVVLHVWVYVRLYMPITRKIRITQFAVYSLISFTIPLALVLVTKHKGLSGMPSYFFQGFTEFHSIPAIRESQRYFIPPVTFILLTCFMLLVGAFFGFKHIEKIITIRDDVAYSAVTRNGKDDPQIPTMDRQLFNETKKDAKCIAFLFIIIVTTWISEVVTFYSPGPEDYLAFMEIINGLQGVFILMIFVIVRQRRDVIRHWWHDRGSHIVTEIQIQQRNATETAATE